MDTLKGMIGLTILTPIAGAAIGGLSVIGSGIGAATQSIVSVGFMGAANKMSGAKKIMRWK